MIYPKSQNNVFKYKLEEKAKDVNSEIVQEFIINVFSGKHKQYFKSESTPLVQNSELKKIVANNFNELVVESKGDFFIEVGTNWCKYCRNSHKIIAKLAKELKDEKRVSIGSIDVGLNDFDFEHKNIPAFFYFKDGYKSKPFKYEGNIELKSIQLYIEKMLDSDGNSSDESNKYKDDL